LVQPEADLYNMVESNLADEARIRELFADIAAAKAMRQP
jgi:hypothetical protein